MFQSEECRFDLSNHFANVPFFCCQYASLGMQVSHGAFSVSERSGVGFDHRDGDGVRSLTPRP